MLIKSEEHSKDLEEELAGKEGMACERAECPLRAAGSHRAVILRRGAPSSGGRQVREEMESRESLDLESMCC